MLNDVQQKVPLLMRVGMWLAALLGGTLWLGLFGAVAGCGNYFINGQAVSSTEFLSVIGIAGATLGSLLLAIAFGIRYERRWSRHLVLAFWLYAMALVAVLSSGVARVSSVLSMAPFLLGSAVYFYAADEVVAYFRAVQARDQRMLEFERRLGNSGT